MGLDMYAFTVPESLAEGIQTDLEIPAELREVKVEMAYWRKFNHLHGWMENLYRSKHGKEEIFNCATVRLMSEDLDKLYFDVTNKKLESIPGFFFGDDKLHDSDVLSTLVFIEIARKEIETGKAVFYDSWW